MSIQRVSPAEAAKLAEEGWALVDVRTEAEFAAGHPTGAWNAPVMLAGAGGMQPNPDFLPAMEKAFAKTDKLVVSCKAGGRSLRAAEMLASAGFTNVIDQRAGFDGARDAFGKVAETGWRDAGLAVEAGEGDRTWAKLRSR